MKYIVLQGSELCEEIYVNPAQIVTMEWDSTNKSVTTVCMSARKLSVIETIDEILKKIEALNQ